MLRDTNDGSSEYNNDEIRKKLDHAGLINEIIGSKWGTLILRELHFNQKMGFNELLKVLPSISSRTLSLQIKKFLKMSMIEKKVLDTSPIRVEYKLTEKGKEFTESFYNLIQWSFKWNF